MLAYICTDSEVSEAELAYRPVTALVEAATTIATWDSDFFSYAKERVRSQVKGHNLVSTLERDNILDVDAAVALGMKYRHRLMGLFLRLKAELLRDASPELKTYITGLCNYMAGCLEWSLRTKRYGSLSGHSEYKCSTGGNITQIPTEDIFNIEPLEIPSIRWWWAYDPARR